MNIQNITQDLISAGFTQTRLAQELTRRGTHCTQPTVCRTMRGSTPSYELGKQLEHLYDEYVVRGREVRKA